MMLRLSFLTLFILIFTACDRKQAPTEPDLDLVYDIVPAYAEINASYPYSFDKFHNVLDQSNYQFPHAQTIVDFGEYDTFKSEAFYADENGDFYFSLVKDFNVTKERSELRQVYKDPQTGKYDTKKGWKTSDKNGNFWISEIRCFKPQITQSYTWMQVHGLNGVDIILNDGSTVKSFNYPLIRLNWERYRDGAYDHIWAIIITSYPRDPKVYEWVDLGERPDDFFQAEVHFQDNLMKIIISGVTIATYDVTYWEDEPNYFKAGIYINRFYDGGTSTIAYRKLRFENNISKI